MNSLGVDEHVWRPGRFGQGREVTCMVDLTRDAHGEVRARLLDLVLGRSGTAYAGWLDAQDETFRAGIKHAALDPFRGYASALRDSPPDAVQVLDAFYVVKLGSAVVDEVRRRVQQEQLGHRGHKDDPLYKIRGLLRHGAEGPHHARFRRARFPVLITGGYCSFLPPLPVISRLNRHRVPVRRLIPTIRHASELPNPRAINRANCSRLAVCGAGPGEPCAIATPDVLECCDHR